MAARVRLRGDGPKLSSWSARSASLPDSGTTASLGVRHSGAPLQPARRRSDAGARLLSSSEHAQV
jgi:hypothetical protein